jgi:hypothetical protein
MVDLVALLRGTFQQSFGGFEEDKPLLPLLSSDAADGSRVEVFYLLH